MDVALAHLHQRLHPGTRGFSLVELALVLAILATVALVAAPRYAGALANYRADAAGRRVVADLELARATARQTSAAVSVTFDAAAARYSFVGLPDPDRRGTPYAVDLAADPYHARLSAVTLQAGGAGGATITFDGYGSANVSGAIEVSSGGVTRMVEIDAATGKATLR